MDLVFTIGGLLLSWSLISYLKREESLIARLKKSIPSHVYSFEVPYGKKTALTELRHFVKRNHLDGCHLDGPYAETWILQSDQSPNLRFPVYIRQQNKSRSLIEIGAVHLNGLPHIFFRKEHQSAAKALGTHLKSTWLRKGHFAKVARREAQRQAAVPLIENSNVLFTSQGPALFENRNS